MRRIKTDQFVRKRCASIVFIIVCVLSLVACDYDTGIYRCRIKQTPSRTEYPIGYDGDIDMTGCTIVGVAFNGRESSWVIEYYKPLSEYSRESMKTIYWDDSNVNYSVPGNYRVYVFYLNNNIADDSFLITIKANESH